MFDCITLDICEELFYIVEKHVTTWTSVSISQCKLICCTSRLCVLSIIKIARYKFTDQIHMKQTCIRLNKLTWSIALGGTLYRYKNTWNNLKKRIAHAIPRHSRNFSAVTDVIIELTVFKKSGLYLILFFSDELGCKLQEKSGPFWTIATAN